MTSDQIEKVFGTLSRIETKLDAHTQEFASHVAMDMEAYKAIGALKVDAAKQKGFVAAMGAVGGGVIAALGYLADKMLGGHH